MKFNSVYVYSTNSQHMALYQKSQFNHTYTPVDRSVYYSNQFKNFISKETQQSVTDLNHSLFPEEHVATVDI